MKAIICTKYGPPEVLRLQEVEKPNPKNKEIQIRIFATAVTASDCIIRSFKLPVWKPMGFMMGLALGFKRPRQPILGIVFSGEVDCIGKDVKSYKKGDQVFGWDLFPAFGAYGEYKCISENGILAIKPANLSYQEAAAIPYGGLLAHFFLKKGNIQKNHAVLIYGASGSVGTSAVQLAKYYGAKVTGVCSTANLDFVKSLGADSVIDYLKEDLSNLKDSYDLIFDAVGKKKSYKFQGNKLLTNNGKFISVDNGTPKIHKEDLVFLKDLVEMNQLKPVIDRCYPLEEIVEAHRYVEKGHKKGNVVITMEHDSDN
jgi:NADPH:quinone reductase-like Zn-dependent oxidoreductase